MITANDNATFLKRTIIDKANAIGAALNDDMATVWKVIDANDIVFAVWSHWSEPDGVGTLIIKGQHRIAAIAAGGEPAALYWTAIPCNGTEQAEALRIVAAERTPLH